MDIDQIKAIIRDLPEEERRKLLSDLNIKHYDKGNYVEKAAKEKEVKEPVKCPHCKSGEVHSRGVLRGVRRYHCTSCNRYFGSNYGTALHWIHKKDKWQEYIKCMEEGLTLRESASRVGISYVTAFNWRHKILSSFQDEEPDRIGGIVEADDTHFAYSEKGNKNLDREPRKRGDSNKTLKENKVPVVVATDRRGNTVLKVAGRGVVKAKNLRPIFKGKFEPQSILCSDGAPVYRGLAKQENIEHIKASRHGRPIAKNKAYHIQSVNQLHKELKQFMDDFNGVSTKYLQNYLNWFMLQKRKQNKDDKVKQWIWLTITCSSALEMLDRLKLSAI